MISQLLRPGDRDAGPHIGFLACLLIAVLLSIPSSVLAASNEAGVNHVEVLLLGTKGGPALMTSKALPESSAIVYGDRIIVVDAGYGASLRLIEAGLKLSNIQSIYITHLHSDHVLDYPALLLNSWATGLKHSINVYGPKGLQALTKNIWRTFSVDIHKRILDEGKPDIRKLISVHEIDQGPVDTGSSVEVAALRVPHPPFKSGKALAYRFRIGGRTIVFTGDLHRFPKGFEEFARDADVLISEAAEPDAVGRLAKRVGTGSTLKKAILSHHVTPEAVGRAAAAAGVYKVVLSHLVPVDDPTLSSDDWKQAVHRHYKGPVVVGHDLMRINVESEKKQ